MSKSFWSFWPSKPDQEHQTFSVDPVTKAAAARVESRNHCACLSRRGNSGRPSVPNLHVEDQAVSASGWPLVTRLIDHAARTHAGVFEPAAQLSWQDWQQVTTLPAEVQNLTDVRELRLYGSHLRRLPPEVGAMKSLTNLDIYTSYSLHWLPYEVTRCAHLATSRMSTRALYGNRKTRLPFPRLSGPIDSLRPKTCSVCDQPLGKSPPQVWWTTQRVGTDDVPLLVHSCSDECTKSLPQSPAGYFARPHKGGAGMPAPDL